MGNDKLFDKFGCVGSMFINFAANNKVFHPGSDGYYTLIHELGHVLGIWHPHDNGGGSKIMKYVEKYSDLGINNSNHSINTVMSYNILGSNSSTYMAIDIEALQKMYGIANLNGLNIYKLKTNKKTVLNVYLIKDKQ